MDQQDDFDEEQFDVSAYNYEHVQQNSIQFTNCQELERYIYKILSGMQEKLYVDTQDHLDNTLNIMVHYSWAEDQIQKSGFYDNDEIKVKLYQNRVLFNYFVEITQGQCQICFKIGHLFQFGCHHFFCQNCYEQYISAKIDEQMGPILQCLQLNCSQTIPYQLIQILSEQTKNKFRISLCKSFLQNNQLYFSCINPKCDNILSSISKNDEITCIKCYNQSCRLCKRQSHYPLQCDQMYDWLQGVNDPLFSLKVHKISIKCQKCKKNMIYEKNDEHLVKCICGASICSGCGSIHYKYSECSLVLLEKYQKYFENFQVLYLNRLIQINKQQQNNKDIIDLISLINYSQVNGVIQYAQQIINQLFLVNNSLVFGLFYLFRQQEKFQELLNILTQFDEAIQQQIIQLVEFKEICTKYFNYDRNEQLVQIQSISQFILKMKQQQEQILNTNYNNLYNVLNMLKIN